MLNFFVINIIFFGMWQYFKILYTLCRAKQGKIVPQVKLCLTLAKCFTDLVKLFLINCYKVLTWHFCIAGFRIHFATCEVRSLNSNPAYTFYVAIFIFMYESYHIHILECLYICTEDVFPNRRLQQLAFFHCKSKKIDPIEITNKIFIEHAADLVIAISNKHLL